MRDRRGCRERQALLPRVTVRPHVGRPRRAALRRAGAAGDCGDHRDRAVLAALPARA